MLRVEFYSFSSVHENLHINPRSTYVTSDKKIFSPIPSMVNEVVRSKDFPECLLIPGFAVLLSLSLSFSLSLAVRMPVSV